ncbi:hypothetical protein ACQ86G_19000 [Roseateles chitinivorans]|uniref:hypothetical protein n=1 Tax=Roseateles chitinivorans TaxID=2917965 RepID=UPI003D67AD9E
MISMKRRNAAVVAAVSVMLAACGGGGNSDTDTGTSQPLLTTPATPTTPTIISPGITTQPANASVLTDGTATFTVAAAGTDVTYQWKKNGTAIAGATSKSYQTPAATFSDNGAQYTVVVSNSAGSVTSSVAQLTLKLSANQQAFENLILAPSAGSFYLHWNLNYAGGQTSGVNYAFSDYGVLPTSPLTTGPQTNSQSSPRNVTNTLALPVASSPTRVLKNGVVLVTGSSSKVSYVGSDVRVDSLAVDNATVAYSEIRSNYEVVPLTGAIASTPADFAHFHNSFFSNANILNATATYAAGSSYLKFAQTNKADRYNVFDCTTATTGAAVTPCRAGMTLTAAMTAGITSNSDGTVYRLTDGTVGTVDGVSVWVATTPRPVSATLSSTVQYRIYFELNGNVYTGALIKDGVLLGGSYYVSNPAGVTAADRLTFLPFDIRMNKAAHDSIVAAMKI